MKSKHFAEFYYYNKDTGGFEPKLGSDGVFYLDGRLSLASMKRKAEWIGLQRGVCGYRIARGTHTDPFYLTAGVQLIIHTRVQPVPGETFADVMERVTKGG